ncbi:hypothetical protein E5288_WYG010373 [Bos mutus]|uniref:Uncharacterized protein n=1 Tax=Bos mutus TaxID=72004 RepID=A0A6B0S1K7_9CETA|nr:hypothetical protein [Bos mutus]
MDRVTAEAVWSNSGCSSPTSPISGGRLPQSEPLKPLSPCPPPTWPSPLTPTRTRDKCPLASACPVTVQIPKSLTPQYIPRCAPKVAGLKRELRFLVSYVKATDNHIQEDRLGPVGKTVSAAQTHFTLSQEEDSLRATVLRNRRGSAAAAVEASRSDRQRPRPEA